MSDLLDIGRDALLALPTRGWQEVSEYASLLIVPMDKKHDSGWRLMAIIGCEGEGQGPKEIAAICDDIEWTFHDADRYGPDRQYAIGQMRTDCCWRSRVLHMWHSGGGRFRVGCSLSTTRVEVLNRERRPEVRPA